MENTGSMEAAASVEAARAQICAIKTALERLEEKGLGRRGYTVGAEDAEALGGCLSLLGGVRDALGAALLEM